VTGPVQVLVVGFDEPSFSGEVMSELTRLRDAGVVRLVDLLLVSRAEDGSLVTLPPPGGVDPTLGRLATVLLGTGDGAEAGVGDERDVWSLDDAVPATGIAAVALIEHVWAQGLVAALRGAGGHPVDETWLAPSDVERLERIESSSPD
jgi:hypothetical protein